MVQIVKYPIYLYHKEYEDPQRVDNKSQQVDLENKGWRKGYIFKEYPRWVEGVLVKTEKEHKLLLAAIKDRPKMKVEIEKTVTDQTGKVISSTGKPKALMTEAPTGKIIQVPATFEIAGPDGEAVPGHEYPTWKEAQKAQKALNEKDPGHKARKKG